MTGDLSDLVVELRKWIDDLGMKNESLKKQLLMTKERVEELNKECDRLREELRSKNFSRM